jgi:hypothetical protein
MFPRTVVQYASPSRPLPRQRIRAPLLASSPLLVLKHLPVTHPWRSDGLVGPSSHSWSLCVDTLALFAGDRRTRALQGIASSTTKLVRRPVLPPTLDSCGSLSKSLLHNSVWVGVEDVIPPSHQSSLLPTLLALASAS